MRYIVKNSHTGNITLYHPKSPLNTALVAFHLARPHFQNPSLSQNSLETGESAEARQKVNATSERRDKN